MLKEPNFFEPESTNDRVRQLANDIREVLDVDPEFLPQLAYYTREELNIRSVSNFMLAFASIDERSRVYLK